MLTHTLNVVTTMGSDHTVSIRLPDAVPEGDVELFVVAAPRETRRTRLGDLLDSEIAGICANRNEITDHAGFAHRLREDAWRRATE